MMLILIWITLAACIEDTFQFSFDLKDVAAIVEEAGVERLLREQNQGTIPPNKPVADLSVLRRVETDPEVHKNEMVQQKLEAVTDYLNKKYNLAINDIVKLPQKSLLDELFPSGGDKCPKSTCPRKCDPDYYYRSANGKCNNLNNPNWGSAGVCFRRILPASYEGQSGLRQSVCGEPLPTSREISLNIHNHINRPTSDINHMYMFFGQFLVHDITQAPISTAVNNQGIQCCPPSNNPHPQCAPIILPKNDPFYSQFNTTCLNFVRSALCPTCKLGLRYPINQVTAFIDASLVYGNSENATNALRTFKCGKLRSVFTKDGEEILPPSPDPTIDRCSIPKEKKICFQAGDPRANQHLTLTCLHTIFMREHNRIADELCKMNPKWDDETTFQEARRIMIAEMQVITHKEYLPITLGKDKMSYYDLWLSDRGCTKYDKSIDPSLNTEFSTAAFRFHSLINSLIAYYPLNETNGRRLLRDGFFQPFEIPKGICGSLLSGVAYSPAQKFDRHLAPDVTNYLYRVRGNPSGLDLAAINIQRGRDHGLPTYVDMIYFCSGEKIKIEDFSDLVSWGYMSSKHGKLLEDMYCSVEDIDLWTGLLMEYHLKGAVVGPTAACILGQQFKKLKYGDRFYFEHCNEFTYQQVKELKKATLSSIICLNAKKVEEMPQNAMLFSSKNNPMIDCKYVDPPHLSYWRD